MTRNETRRIVQVVDANREVMLEFAARADLFCFDTLTQRLEPVTDPHWKLGVEYHAVRPDGTVTVTRRTEHASRR